MTKRKKAMIAITIIFLVIGLGWLIYWLLVGQFYTETEDAYVNGNMTQLTPQISGTVTEINTDETQIVTENQIVIQLDTTDYEVALERAKADLAQTVRNVRQYFENFNEAESIVALRNADFIKAQLDLDRRIGLVGKRAISREERSHYETAVETTHAAYNAALANMRSMLALIEHSSLYTHPLVEQAKANLKMAYVNLKRTTIVARVTGYVAMRKVQIGSQVSTNTPMLGIVPLDDVWVDANYKETQLKNLRIDQPVILTADAYPGMTYHGRVVGLNPGTGTVFSLLPAQNAVGNWIKIVQRLPVRIRLELNELKTQPLQLGLSMDVTVDTHDRQGLKLITVPLKGPLYSTDVYSKQIAGAQELIEQILKDNAPNNMSQST